MSVKHHPSDEMLAAFAAGTLDLGQRVAVATHLMSCPKCSAFRRAMEQIGGEMLAGMPPTDVDAEALKKLEARLDRSVAQAAVAAMPSIPETEIPGLPDFVRRYPAGRWKWIAPSIYLRPIVLPVPSETRVFLLKSGPGTKMLQHSHTDVELTCVLSGAFSHQGGRFGPGDFDLGDETVNHQPVVDASEPCVCLVAMQGKLRLNGLIGQIMQPFVRL